MRERELAGDIFTTQAVSQTLTSGGSGKANWKKKLRISQVKGANAKTAGTRSAPSPSPQAFTRKGQAPHLEKPHP